MVAANDLRSGIVIEFEGKLYEVVEYSHLKPGKGGAFVKVKIKDIRQGSVLDRTFRPADKFEQIHIEGKKYQYLYREGDTFHFMNSETYEQISFGKDHIGDNEKYMKDGMELEVLFYKERTKEEATPLRVEMPKFVELKVTESASGLKGDTVSAPTKEITVETGYKIQAPLFIKEGDVVRVSTETGKYVERA